jgi:hypothetical protein
MLITGPAFQACHGDGWELVRSVLSRFQFGHRHRSHAHRDRERERGVSASVTVSQPRHLLGIADQACELHARVVIALEPCGRERDVGAEPDRRAVRRGFDGHDDTDVACALPLVDHLGVADQPLIPRRDLYKARSLRPRHVAVIRLRAAGSETWRTIIEVAAVGIATPVADRMEP